VHDDLTHMAKPGTDFQSSERNLAAPAHDPAGNPLVAIILEHHEHDWRHDRIGQWIATYRRDLLA
jgi:hypothetical protein